MLIEDWEINLLRGDEEPRWPFQRASRHVTPRHDHRYHNLRFIGQYGEWDVWATTLKQDGSQWTILHALSVDAPRSDGGMCLSEEWYPSLVAKGVPDLHGGLQLIPLSYYFVTHPLRVLYETGKV